MGNSSSESATYLSYRLLHQAVQLCHAHGIERVVLCPGSRSAPIALGFMRFEGITHYMIPDERSAAYTALGMAWQSKKTVALVCTSGTAALNFAPAVAEAFFSEVPLIVFTADRPVEWVGQADNQAIHQSNLYGKHAKASYSFPTDLYHPYTTWYALRQTNEALNIANQHPKGPVHINVPLREPLYLENEPVFDGPAPKKIELVNSKKNLPIEVLESLKQFSKILVVAGTHKPNLKLREALSKLASQKRIVFISDITSNLTGIPSSVSFADLVIEGNSSIENPDLVISFGGPIVSKTLKNYLRNSSVQEHWHLSGHAGTADTFQKLTRVFDIDSVGFFEAMLCQDIKQANEDFASQWLDKDSEVASKTNTIMATLPYGEIRAAFEIMKGLPNNTVLHLGNSLPVRFASVFPFLPEGIDVYSNRGTSGIDGTVSSAAGQSMVDDRTHVLICGDLAFMYDSNGLWNNYLRDNLKIIVFNNHGGGIFRQLPGSKDQKELEEYFAVKQPLSFEHTAKQHNCHYFSAKDLEGIKEKLVEFYSAKDRPAVMELEFGEGLSISQVKGLINNLEA